MPLSFPSNPSLNQTSTQNGRVFRWSGSAWEFATVGASGNLTGTVTIPASGDQQWSNVVLLLKGDGNLTDSSSYSRSVAAYGDAAATGAAKFGSASFAFDGNGDYLRVDSMPSFGGGDWTIEAWVYITSFSSGMFLFGASVDNGLMVHIATDGKLYVGRASVSWDLSETHGMSVNTWHHLAICRSGNQIRAWRDGTPLGSAATSLSGSFGSSPLWIGAFGYSSGGAAGQPSNYVPGRMDDIRFTSGVARYSLTSGFSPPAEAYGVGAYVEPVTLPVSFTGGTSPVLADPSALRWATAPASPTATGTAGQVAYDSQGFLYLCTQANTWVRYTGATWVPPDPLFSNVILLLHGDTSIADSSSGVRAGTNNGTTISSTRKFGAGSLSMAGGNISFANESAFDMGTAWTVEAWVYIPSFGTDAGLACRGDFNNSNQWDGLQFAIRIGGNASVTTYFWGSGSSQQIVDVPNVLQEATWHHIAAVRDGAVGRVYVDGNLIGSRSDLNSPVSSTYPIIVGKWTAFRSGSGGLQGLIDDFRVTKAARYSGSTITVPTAAFPDA